MEILDLRVINSKAANLVYYFKYKLMSRQFIFFHLYESWIRSKYVGQTPWQTSINNVLLRPYFCQLI